MSESNQKIASVRLYVLFGGLAGLVLTLMIAVVRNDQASGFSADVFVALFGGPFILALLSLLVRRVAHQRWVWLACSLLTAIAGLPLVFSGVGFFSS